MIVVIDTGVWISALIFGKNGGTPKRCLDLGFSRDVIATSTQAEAELHRILAFKFAWPQARITEKLRGYLSRSITVQLRGTVHLCRDPNDDMFLECAQRADADLLITGNKDLLVLGSHKRTQIITPAQYVSGHDKL